MVEYYPLNDGHYFNHIRIGYIVQYDFEKVCAIVACLHKQFSKTNVYE